MSNTYYVSTTGSNSNSGSQASPFLTIQAAINAASNGNIINVAAGTYSEQVLVNKSLTINGAQYDVSAINNDGTIRNTSNTNETVVQGNTAGSGICFTITANNVIIDGFKCVLPATNLVRDAFNLRVIPAGSGNTATLENITIKNNIIQNLRNNTSQCQAIVFGESSTNVNNASNGNGIWNNVEIANNYFDISAALNGYRGVQFGSHFHTVTFNVNIHDNRFIHSASITSNRAIGVISQISARGPSYLNGFKIKNNYFNTPGNTSIGGFYDCDANCEISNNTFMNCKYGISSINFREVGGKIENNTFTVTEYAMGIYDNEYATTNGFDITISGNSFNNNSTKHIECSSQNVSFNNLQANNTFNGYVRKDLSSTYNQYGNVANPLLNRTTRSVYPTIQKGIDATGTEVITVGAGTYAETVTLGSKSLTLNGANSGVNASNSRSSESIINISSSTGSGFVLNNSANVIIDGFKVSGPSDSSGSRGFILGNTNSVPGPIQIKNNIIENFTTGISLGGGATAAWVSGVTVSGNKFSGNVACIGSTENVNGLTVSNNNFIVSGSGNEAIGLGGGLTSFATESNIFAITSLAKAIVNYTTTAYAANLNYWGSLYPNFSDLIGKGDESSEQVTVSNWYGDSALSILCTSPDAPSLGSITLGNGQLSVPFTAGSANNLTITNYQYSTDNGSNWTVRSPASADSPIVITGLDNGSSYTVKLRAVNAAGPGSASSGSAAIPRTVPNAPVIAAIVPGDKTLSVDFSTPYNGGNDITSYKVYRNGNLIATLSDLPLANLYLDNDANLVIGNSYSYTVSATNDAGEGNQSEPSEQIVDGKAFAPTNFVATRGDSLASLSWTAADPNGGSIVNHIIYYRQVSAPSYNSEPTNSPDTSYSLVGLTNGTSYNVYVVAVDQLGESYSSSVQTVTPLAVPRSPIITGIIADLNSITITFTAPDNGGSPITNYEYQMNNQTNWISANKTSSPIIITGILNDTTYSFIIRAINLVGNGNLSNNVNTTTQVGPITNLIVPLALAPSVASDAGVSSFETKIEDIEYSQNSGIAYGVNTGYIGAVSLFTINAFDSSSNQLTDFSANPITVNLTLPNANPLNSPLKIYKRQSETSNALMSPQPAGYPADVTYVSGNIWTTTLTSLSSYLIQDPNAPAAAAGGDPHLKQVDGTCLTIPNEWKYVRLYECDDIKVFAKCEHINDEIISELHRKDKKQSIVNINKHSYKDYYVMKYTYFIELDFYKNDELCVKLDSITGEILYNNKKISIDHIWNSNKGIYSLTHKCAYEPIKYIEYCVHLHNGDYLQVGIDNFWDDINSLGLCLSKNNSNYKGEFFIHTIENAITNNNQQIKMCI